MGVTETSDLDLLIVKNTDKRFFDRIREVVNAQLGFREKYFSQACFLSQQVVEKSLKAFLLAKGRTYPRQHKVIELAKLCTEIAGDLEPLKDDLKAD